jgi:FMN phosphatase YigB (HAD superfamily)
MLDAMRSIVVIHSALEALRAIGKTVSLVVMPDFYILPPKLNSGTDPVASDGRGVSKKLATVLLEPQFEGHAGITMAALAALRIKDDQVFKIWPVIKAGEVTVGTIDTLLANLYRDKRCETVPTEYIYIMGDGLDRHTSVTEQDGKPKRTIMSLEPDMQMTMKELFEHPNHPMRILEYCMGLGFLSLDYWIADVLIDWVHRENKSKPVILVDTACLDETTDLNCIRTLKRLKTKLTFVSMSARDAATFVNRIHKSRNEPDQFDPLASMGGEDGYKAAKYLAEECGIDIMLHHDKYCALVTAQPDSGFIIPSFQICPKATNGAGDTFNAGLLLASSVKQAIETNQEAIARFRVPAITLDDCMIYASALTAARLHYGYFVTCHELYQFVSEHKCRDLTNDPKFAWTAQQRLDIRVVVPIDSKTDGDKRIQDAVDESAPVDRRLCGVAELCYKQIPNTLLHLSQQPDPLIAVNALASLRHYRHTADRKAVFLDVDGTLFDSKCMRELAGESALRQLELGNSVVRRIEMIRCIYDDWPFFSRRLALQPDCDFRQKWNTAPFYKVLYMIFKDMSPSISVGKHYAEVKQRLNNDPAVEEELIAFIQSDEYDVTPAITTFDRYPFHPWSDARAVIRSLKEDLGIDLYIVTEGNRDYQLWKLWKLGLADLFQIEKQRGISFSSPISLVTGAFANPKQVNDHLQRAARKTRAEETEGKRLEVIKQLYRRRIKEMREAFHAYAIQAVLNAPDNPRAKMEELMSKDNNYAECVVRSTRIAVIGDRPDTDAVPFKAVNKNIGTIRLHKGHYKDTEISPESVDVFVESLTMALTYLATSGFWDQHPSVTMPIAENYTLSKAENDALDDIAANSTIQELRDLAYGLLKLSTTGYFLNLS